MCVTVRQQKFIYTGGEEDGAVISLINYPKYPKKENEIWGASLELAKNLRQEACQDLFLIMDKHNTYWFSNRS